MFTRLIACLVLTLSFSQVVSAEDNSADGDRLAECYAVYDALVGLGDLGKLPPAETERFKSQREKAKDLALSQYSREGLDSENANGQLEGRAEYMREELRDLHDGSGIYNADEMRKMASACDATVGN